MHISSPIEWPPWAPGPKLGDGKLDLFMLVGGAVIVVSMLCYAFFDSWMWQPLRAKVRASSGEFYHMELLGKKRNKPRIEGTCVIAGASLAGLLTARVAMDHFEKVVLIEPDTQLEEKRGRVVQWPHAHYFGNGFYTAVRSLFPGVFAEESTKEGIFLHEPGLGRFVFGDKVLPAVETGIRAFGAQRMSMERFVRRAFARSCPSRPEVVTIKGSVTDLVPSKDGQRVDGVRVKEDNGKEYTMPTSLVIDCTGPACGGLKWLSKASSSADKDPSAIESGVDRRHAWRSPEQWRYKPSLNYYTALIRVKPEDMASLPKPPAYGNKDWNEIGVLLVQIPSLILGESLQLALMLHGEMGTFTLLAGGSPEEGAKVRTLDDFRRVVRGVDRHVLGTTSPEWQEELISAFERLEREGKTTVEFKQYRNGASTYNRYFEAENLPADFIAVGDSLVFTNPRFAMGTRKIITEIGILNKMLHDIDATKLESKGRLEPLSPSSLLFDNTNSGVSSDDTKQTTLTSPSLPQKKLTMDFGKRYFAEAHQRDLPVWQFCLAEDYASPSTKIMDRGDSLSKGWFERWYRLAMGRVAAEDAEVSKLLIRLLSSDVSQSPIDPLHPKLFLRTLMHMPAVVWRYKIRRGRSSSGNKAEAPRGAASYFAASGGGGGGGEGAQAKMSPKMGEEEKLL